MTNLIDGEKAFKEIKKILIGIDYEVIVGELGWWDTSKGAEFGAEKLKLIKAVLTESDKDS